MCVCLCERTSWAFVFKVKCFIVCGINENPPRCSCTAQTPLSSFLPPRQHTSSWAPSYINTCPDAQKTDSSDGAAEWQGSGGGSWTELEFWKTFFPNQSWPRVSLHSSAALTASACCSTHTTLLPSTLLCTLLIYSTVYHSNPLPLTGKRYVLGRPDSIRGVFFVFFFKGMLRKNME